MFELNSDRNLYISLVTPVYNEAECITEVLEEAIHVLDGLNLSYEVIVVDDGSTDDTSELLSKLLLRFSCLRVLTLIPNSGQSAAFGAGFRQCRGNVAILMDSDGQNDPHDIPKLLDEIAHSDVCCGYREHRQDTLSKRLGSRFANAVRQHILHDGIRDTGCSLKAIKTEYLRDLPMALRGMHRFLPALLIMRGASITQIAVNHRSRSAGCSKYTNLGRLKETVFDLWAVRWMQKRHRAYRVTEVGTTC